MNKNKPQLNTLSPYVEPIENKTLEEAKLMQSIETNDKLDSLNKTSEAALLESTKNTDAVKELSPAMEALVKLNAELLDVIREHQKIDLTAFSKVKTITLQGEKGDTPTDDELVKLIKPLIPEPLKGDDGHTPTEKELIALIEPLIVIPKPIKGKDGKDYVLKEQDKEDIAAMIEVPIVDRVIEKTEVIKEVRVDETPEELVEKINSKPKSIDWKTLKNVPDIKGNWGPSSPSTSTPSTGGGANFETPSGAIDGANATFTVLNTPKCIILNGVMYFEGDGAYTLSVLTITILAPYIPTTGSTLRSMY